MTIQITLPLDTFEGAESLTPEGITAFLHAAIENKEKVQKAKDDEKRWREVVIQWSNHLDRLLEADIDDFQKRQYLRNFAAEARQQAKAVEERQDS